MAIRSGLSSSWVGPLEALWVVQAHFLCHLWPLRFLFFLFLKVFCVVKPSLGLSSTATLGLDELTIEYRPPMGLPSSLLHKTTELVWYPAACSAWVGTSDLHKCATTCHTPHKTDEFSHKVSYNCRISRSLPWLAVLLQIVDPTSGAI